MSNEFSIIVSVFNRAWCVERALLSSVRFLENIGGGEVVVIDDGSTDDSIRVVHDFIASNENTRIRFKFLKQPNGGVCSAKNAGACASSNYWLIFLDSDDELLPESARSVSSALDDANQPVLNFFRCVDEVGGAVGRVITTRICRTFDELIRFGTDGESTPVVRRDVFIRYQYDEDINGFEGLSYLRIVRRYGHATVHPILVRKYYTQHDDRLSSFNGIKRRSFNLVKGYLRIFFEHYRILSLKSELYIWARVIFHSSRGVVFWMCWR